MPGQAWRLRQSLAKLEQAIELRDSSDRYVDYTIRIVVVEQDPEGVEVLPGSPTVRLLRHSTHGGIYDRLTKTLGDHSEDPLVWYLTEVQEKLVLHEKLPDRLLVYGAMGAGKTRVLAAWLVLRVIELLPIAAHRQVCVGATAPTQNRRDELVELIKQSCRPEWYTYSAKKAELHFAGGIIVQARATKMQSSETGSPIQGQTWMACASDEIQDSTRANADIEMRGRGAPDGRYRRLCTATAKDSMLWREFRDSLDSTLWGIERLEGPSNWTVSPRFWEEKKRTMDAREYRMKVLALDVGPERAVYPAWSRDYNLAAVPAGARDVTEIVLAGTGPGFKLLLGHDPGVLRNATVMLRAYELRGGERVWFVVDEFETRQTTTEQHATLLLQRLQAKWQVNIPGEHGRVLIRNDPWSERDGGTHRSVYEQFKQLGFSVLSAAYSKRGEGNKSVPVRARIEMVNRLLRSAAGTTRLFVQAGVDGKSVAPGLVRAIELSEWDAWGMRETGRKDDKDKDPTDHTTALGYALWPYERVRPREGVRSTGMHY